MGYVQLLRSGVVSELLNSSRLCLGSASRVLENVPGAAPPRCELKPRRRGHRGVHETAADLPL
jgi:hypothetical protein